MLGEPYHILLPDTARAELLLVVRFLYTGTISVPRDRVAAVTEIAVTLGLSKLIETVTNIVKMETSSDDVEQVQKTQLPPKVRTSVSPTYFERRVSEQTPSPPSCPPCPPSTQPSRPGDKRQNMSGSSENLSPNKKIKMESHPMLQSILSQFPLNPTFIQSLAGNLAPKEKDPWSDNISATPPRLISETPGYFAADLNQLEALGKLQSLKEASSLGGGAYAGSSQNQLANILTAAAKLKQVAEQAISMLNIFLKNIENTLTDSSKKMYCLLLCRK